MRLVRVDSLAPGGAPLEVHPRLTLLRGASPELVRRLRTALRALVGLGELDESGVIEVSGVRLALDPPTVAQLRVDVKVDPVLTIGAPPLPTATAEHPAADPVVGSDEVTLRAELRQVSDALSDLGRRMDLERAGLDSFASAALDVCVGQIEALESRRASLRVGWEGERDRGPDLEQASAQFAALQAMVGQLVRVEQPGRRLREAVRASEAVRAGSDPNPAALSLADALEPAATQVREAHERQRRVRAEFEEAARALESARADLEAVERRTQVDREVVQRLEAIRDEILAVDDRNGMLGSVWAKRHLVELRSEEAILLDRLGFDTYSAYVMGIPSLRAQLERSAPLAEARERVEALQGRLDELHGEVADRSRIDAAEQRLHGLVTEALARLEVDAVAPSPVDLGRGVVSGDFLGDLDRASAMLRERVEADPDALERSRQDVVSAMEFLLAATESLRSAVGSEPALSAGPVRVPPVPSIPAGPAAGDPLSDAEQWLDWLEQLRGWNVDAQEALAELERVVADLTDRSEDPRIARWAEVEAELDQALDRLADAQDRVRAHEVATTRLGELRAEELGLRERERDLLARIAAAEGVVTAAPIRTRAPGRTAGGAIAEGNSTAGAPAEGADEQDPDELEWSVVARLARLRSVSFVGSLPLLVEGIPADPAARERVLGRLDRMSDLVQIIVVGDDDTAAAWAAGLGDRGARVDL